MQRSFILYKTLLEPSRVNQRRWRRTIPRPVVATIDPLRFVDAAGFKPMRQYTLR
jgi:hypothetical protein